MGATHSETIDPKDKWNTEEEAEPRKEVEEGWMGEPPDGDLEKIDLLDEESKSELDILVDKWTDSNRIEFGRYEEQRTLGSNFLFGCYFKQD